METARRKIAAAARLEDPLRRQMTIAGIIAAELDRRGTRTVMVGGSAVEFYTLANYTTIDIDMVAASPENIGAVMTGLGFVNNGGTWYLPDAPQIIVEFPAGPLAGSWDRVQPVLIDDEGVTVNVIGLEDLLIDRALAVAYWSDSPEWVRFMMLARYDDIDWRYLQKRALAENCLDTIKKCRTWAQRHRRKPASPK